MTSTTKEFNERTANLCVCGAPKYWHDEDGKLLPQRSYFNCKGYSPRQSKIEVLSTPSKAKAKKERKSAYEILVAVEKEFLENPLSNWNEIAKKVGSQWFTIRQAHDTLKVLRSRGYLYKQRIFLEEMDKKTEQETKELFESYGLGAVRKVEEAVRKEKKKREVLS